MTTQEKFKKLEYLEFEYNLDGTIQKAMFVDGEKAFDELGASAGFIHFLNVKTGKRLGFCGIDWAYDHFFTSEQPCSFSFSNKG